MAPSMGAVNQKQRHIIDENPNLMSVRYIKLLVLLTTILTIHIVLG
jgi:hypothetical protein